MFNNLPIPIDSLPQVADLPMQALDRRYLKVRQTGNVIFILLLVLGFFLYLLISGDWFWGFVQIGALVLYPLLAGLLWYTTRRSFESQAYALRTHDLTYRRGWIWRKTTTIPYRRIQHSEIEQGPIERYFGLAHLNVYTSGGSEGDLSLPGLEWESAEKIRDFIKNAQ